jgi:hypothetical protein
VIGAGLYFAKKVVENPIEAAAAVLSTNPDVEVLSKDADKGLITVRDKRNGKTVTVDLEQIKQGKLFVATDGKEVQVEAGEGGVRVKSSEGETAVIGGGQAKLPSWIPAYPGAEIHSALSAAKDDRQSAMVGFTTTDPLRRVLEFYTDGLKKNGFTIESQTMVSDTAAVVTAKSESPKRTAVVNVAAENGKTNVGLIFSDKE